MSLQFFDPCGDDYAAGDVGLFWTQNFGTITVNTSGRFGSGSFLRLGAGSPAGGVLKTLPGNFQTLIIGFAFRASAAPTGASFLMQMLDAGTNQIILQLNSDSTFSFVRGATTLNTSAFAFSLNTWYYIEVKIKVDPSVGTVDLKIDGVNKLSGSGLNTRNTANSTANQVRINSYNLAATNVDIDDVYVCDSGGSANNDFLGDQRVECLSPGGAGNTTQLAVTGAASNYLAVNEAAEDGDTSYVATSTTGQYDTYATGDLSSTPLSIKGTMEVVVARKDDAGTHTAAAVLRSGTTDNVATAGGLTTTFTALTNIRETDPNTGVAWTASGVNAAEIGVKMVS
jgi:hypothetical protein